jgi:MFS family permease
MNITNFLLKGMMTFAFMIIPIILTKTYHWELNELYKIYLPAMVVGILAMGPSAMIAEKRGKFKAILLIGIVVLALAYFLIGSSSTYQTFGFGVVVFFIGFNIQEPILQSLATKYAKIHQRGEALGIFNSFGYFGTFVGGFVGGMLLDMTSLSSISYGIIIICIIWIMMIITLENPAKTKLAYIHLDETDHSKHNELHTLNGIKEWYINDTEHTLVIKYNIETVNKDEIMKAISLLKF